MNSLYLAWRYLVCHWIKTGILVLSITLIVYLPAGLRVLIGQSAEELTARAEATPLLVGAKGSPLELVLNSLYFESESPATLSYSAVSRVAETGLATPIPLYVRYHARGRRIVGTTPDYFEFRRLRLAAGRSMVGVGECVLGARVARTLGLGPEDAIVSSPETVFDLAGVYPIKMRVAGILRPAHTPDDDAIFVDVKTAWIIEGLCHGHRDLTAPEAMSTVLKREEKNIVANASVVQYTEITASNADSFHFHGDQATFPITAIIAVPRNPKSGTILRGRYQGPDEVSQIVTPAETIEELLRTILTVESYVIAAMVAVGLSTVATAALVFMLSLRLRRREIETMVKIGGCRLRIAAVIGWEVAIVLVLSATLAALLSLVTSAFGSAAIRALILS